MARTGSPARALMRAAPLLHRISTRFKGLYEYVYWWRARRREGTFRNAHYERVFTTDLGLDPSFYEGKRILDVGCGPRGSLEWAEMAAERVGLDPLVSRYRRLGIDEHAMTYVDAPAEDIPFPDSHFDVVSSINSLDHVDDLDATIAEMIRVLCPGGQLLLVVDIHDRPTIAEPIVLDWNLTERFEPQLEVLDEAHFEHARRRRGALAALRAGVPFEHTDGTSRYGTLRARLRKRVVG